MVSLEEHYVIQTPEGVSIYLILAGVGSRILAFAIDFFIMTAAIFVVLIAVTILGIELEGGSLGRASGGIGYAFEAIGFVYMFFVYFGYFVLFEVLGGGRSPGKRVMGLRVVRLDGSAVGFRTSLLRNLLRIVDSFPPPTYLVGLVLIFIAKRHQRLGDLAAGTIVIRDRPGDRNALLTGVAMASTPMASTPMASTGSMSLIAPASSVQPAVLVQNDAQSTFSPQSYPQTNPQSYPQTNPQSYPQGDPQSYPQGDPPPPYLPQSAPQSSQSPPQLPHPLQDPQQLQHLRLQQQPQVRAYLPYGWDLTGLHPQELRLVEEFLNRRWSLSTQARTAWGDDLARHVRDMVVAPGAPPDAEGFLEVVAYVKHMTNSA